MKMITKIRRDVRKYRMVQRKQAYLIPLLNAIARVEGEEARTRAANKVLILVSTILEEDSCDGTELAAAG